MIAEEFLNLLRCPITRQTLTVADKATLDQANAHRSAVAAARNAGAEVDDPIVAGLVRADRQMLYPIRDGIPVLLVEEGIAL